MNNTNPNMLVGHLFGVLGGGDLLRVLANDKLWPEIELHDVHINTLDAFLSHEWIELCE